MNEITSDLRGLEIKDDFYPMDNPNIVRLKEICNTAIFKLIQASTQVKLILCHEDIVGIPPAICKDIINVTDKDVSLHITIDNSLLIPQYVAEIRELLDDHTDRILFEKIIPRHDIPTLIEKAGVVKCQ